VLSISRALVLCFLILFACRPLAAQLGGSTRAAAGELLVGLASDSSTPQTRQMMESVGIEVQRLGAIGVSRLRLRSGVGLSAAIRFLQGAPGIRFVEPNVIISALTTPNDPAYGAFQWGPQQIQADLAWDLWRPQKAVVLAIIDSGIDLSHPDLTNKIHRVNGAVVGYNVFTQETGAAFDDHGHGTHCAGIAAAQVNNGVGMAGVAAWTGDRNSSDADFIKLMPVKVLSNTGNGTASGLADGIIWAADHGAQVLSMSLGTSAESETVRNAVGYALDKGCILVAAAGNSGNSQRVYPAAHEGVISVAATTRSDRLASFSTYGDWVSIAAPGELIYSTLPTYAVSGTAVKEYGNASGTSMACPHVAGAAAMLLAHEPRLNRFQVTDLLTKQVDPIVPEFGQTLASGGGRLNLNKAMRYLAGATPQPPPDSTPVTVSQVTIKPDTVGGGSTAAGEVRLNRTAPSGGATVSLSSDQAAVMVPATVTVPAGSASAPFNVTTSAVTATVTATISAKLGGETKTATLIVTPDESSIRSIVLTPSTVFSGNTVTLSVTLQRRAPPGGAEVALSSSDPALAPVPATLLIPEGASSASATFTAGKPAQRTSVAITATRLGASRTKTLEIRP